MHAQSAEGVLHIRCLVDFLHRRHWLRLFFFLRPPSLCVCVCVRVCDCESAGQSRHDSTRRQRQHHDDNDNEHPPCKPSSFSVLGSCSCPRGRPLSSDPSSIFAAQSRQPIWLSPYPSLTRTLYTPSLPILLCPHSLTHPRHPSSLLIHPHDSISSSNIARLLCSFSRHDSQPTQRWARNTNYCGANLV